MIKNKSLRLIIIWFFLALILTWYVVAYKDALPLEYFLVAGSVIIVVAIGKYAIVRKRDGQERSLPIAYKLLDFSLDVVVVVVLLALFLNMYSA